MRLIVLSYLVCCGYLTTLLGQTIPSFYQYSAARTYANPALPFQGYNELHNLSLQIGHRMESLQPLNEVPFQQTIQLNWMPQKGVQFQPHLGVGVFKNQFGPTRSTDLFLKVGAINYDNANLGTLSAAVHLGLSQFEIAVNETQGLAPPAADPLLASNPGETHPNLGMGFYFESATINGRYRLYTGASVPKIFAFDLTSVVDLNANRLIQPIYTGLLGGKIFTGAFSYWDISAWVIQEEAIGWRGDVVAKYFLKQPALWAGIGYSTTNNYRIETGMHFNYLRGQSKRLYQNKGQYFSLSLAYNFTSNSVPTQLNHGIEFNFAWVLATN